MSQRDHYDDVPLIDVMHAVIALRAGRDVDLAALRASTIAKSDQIEAMARTVPGLEPLTSQTVPLLRVLDDLDHGDVDGAIKGIEDLFRRVP